MKRIPFLLLIVAVACNQPADNTTTKDSTTVVSYDTIPEIRTTVKSTPAAEYSDPIKDELNNWKFAVALYETRRTFHYTVRIQAKEARVTDSINIPNFGTMPKVVIQKGKEPLTCIIGFLDKKGQFMPYRQVSFMNDRLRIRTIQSYSVGAYRTPVNN
ncbi:MAG: hypothetical protein V4557_11060 [Bacteroidota bacterium]